MVNDINKKTVQQLRDKAAKAKAIIVTDYAGLDANTINKLRTSMKNTDAELSVAKNTLVKIALKEEKLDSAEINAELEGTNAVIFGYSDAIAPIKALFEFVKSIELPKVKAAIIEGRFSNATEVETLSKLPSKEQLLARAIGGMKSPLSGFVGVLGGVQRKLVYALADLAKSKK